MLTALLVCATVLPAVLAQTSIPAALANLLSVSYPGWRLAEIPREPGVNNVLSGDYDGDGNVDYAVLINYENAGKPASRSTRAVALLQRTSGAELVPVSRVMHYRHNDDLSLRLARRGSRGYDLNTDKWFIYEQDSIIVEPVGRGPCNSFIYRNGKFFAVWTCD